MSRETARLTEAPDAVRLAYLQAELDYRLGAAEARLPGGDLVRVSETSLELALPGSRAQSVADRWLAEAVRAQERAQFRLPLSALGGSRAMSCGWRAPGRTSNTGSTGSSISVAREIEAVRIEPSLYLPTRAPERRIEPPVVTPPGPMTAIVMDLPLADGSTTDGQPWLAASAEPWPGEAAVYASADGEGFDLVARVRKPAVIGVSAGVLPPGAPGRWQRVGWDVLLPSGTVSAASRLAVLNGANRLAVELPSGEWEILQFRDAELTGADAYRLGYLLRGQRGTDVLSAAPIAAGARLVLLDDALVALPVSAAERGLKQTWRVGPATADMSDPQLCRGERGACRARGCAPSRRRICGPGGRAAIWRSAGCGRRGSAAATSPPSRCRWARRARHIA